MPRIWGLSKTANYRQAPRAEVRCDACRFMFPQARRGGCRYVSSSTAPALCAQSVPNSALIRTPGQCKLTRSGS
jgi:hypothetical protein